jgi:hypothetical protein
MLQKNLINEAMSQEQILRIMGDGDTDAIEILKTYLVDVLGLAYIYALDSIGIRGTNLSKLYNKCCNGDMELFDSTLGAFLNKVYKEEDIEANLKLEKPVPFIDSTIILLDEFDEESIADYYATNKKIFKTKFKDALKFDKPYTKSKKKKRMF